MQFVKLFAILCTLGAVRANTLQCYVCEGDACNDIKDSMLDSCGPQTIITTTIPTPTDTSSAASVESSTVTDSEVSVSTSASSTTESSAGSSSTTSNSAASSSTTDISIKGSSTTLNAVASNSPASSPTPTNSVTEEILVGSSTTAAAVESSPEPPQSAAAIVSGPQLSRHRRSISETFLQEYRQRSGGARSNEVTYSCFSVDITVNGATNRKHGCVEVAAGTTACAAVEQQNAGATNCETCTTDKCNGSDALTLSLIALLSAALLQLIFK